MVQEYAYWMALAHLKNMSTAKKNELVVRCVEQKRNLAEFFSLGLNEKNVLFSITSEESLLIEEANKQVSNYSFMAEDLLNQGYDIIPITSPNYPLALKENLKRTLSPTLLYTKGNKKILHEKAIAMIGSKNAKDPAFAFVNEVAKKASQSALVVLSGFTKGIDRESLDAAARHKGKAIIVLPQGITTFAGGMKQYYRQIVDGDFLVLSPFLPNASWSPQFAVARTPIIYGLASEVYVVESRDKGETWSAAVEELKKSRSIYVRSPLELEKNANALLIERGGIPVDQAGNILKKTSCELNLFD